jgi:hypothetical protein
MDGQDKPGHDQMKGGRAASSLRSTISNSGAFFIPPRDSGDGEPSVARWREGWWEGRRHHGCAPSTMLALLSDHATSRGSAGFAWSPSPAPFHYAGADKRNSFSRRIICIRGLLATARTIATKKESGAPKGALSNQCSAISAAACRAARRLSALTLAALTTGYYPDGSAPEPGFPRRRLTGVLPASRKKCRG